MCLDLKPPYPAEVAAKPYKVEYIIQNSRNLMEDKEIRAHMSFIYLITWELVSTNKIFVWENFPIWEDFPSHLMIEPKHGKWI